MLQKEGRKGVMLMSPSLCRFVRWRNFPRFFGDPAHAHFYHSECALHDKEVAGPQGRWWDKMSCRTDHIT